MIGVEKERGVHEFLIFGTTIPLFHVRPRGLSSYLPIFLKLKKYRMLLGSDYTTPDKMVKGNNSCTVATIMPQQIP